MRVSSSIGCSHNWKETNFPTNEGQMNNKLLYCCSTSLCAAICAGVRFRSKGTHLPGYSLLLSLPWKWHFLLCHRTTLPSCYSASRISGPESRTLSEPLVLLLVLPLVLPSCSLSRRTLKCYCAQVLYQLPIATSLQPSLYHLIFNTSIFQLFECSLEDRSTDEPIKPTDGRTTATKDISWYTGGYKLHTSSWLLFTPKRIRSIRRITSETVRSTVRSIVKRSMRPTVG